MQGNRTRIGLLLLLLSLALNTFFIGQNLPQVAHPDEPKVVRRAIAMGSGDLNPHVFHYPTLWLYLVFLTQGAAAAAGLGMGLIRDLGQLQVMAFTDPTLFYVVSRLLAALLGAGSVWLTWRIGERLAPGAGVIAALLVALNGPQIWQSHYATGDGPLVFFVLLCLWMCFRGLESGWMRSVWAPALLAGFATSVKYNGVAVCGAVAVLVWIVGREQRLSFGAKLKYLAGAMAVALGGFLVTSPFAVLDYHAFRLGLRGVANSVVEVGTADTPWTYPRIILGTMGLPAVAAAVFGWGAWLLSPSFRVHRGKILVLAGFLVPYAVLLQTSDVKVIRFVLPVVPVVALGTGVALAQIRIWVGPGRRVPARVGAAGLAALFLAPVLGPAREAESYFLHASARTRTARWVERHLPPGSTVFLDSSAGPELPPHRDVVEPRLRKWRASNQPRAVALAKAYSVYLETGAADRGFHLVPSDSLLLFTFSSGWDPGHDYLPSRLEGVRYVIVAADSLQAAREPHRSRFYREVSDRFRIIHEERSPKRGGIIRNQPGSQGERILVLERKQGSGP